MSKFKSFIVACLLIITSFLFVACGQINIENFSFKESNLYLTIGDRIELEFNYEPAEAELNVEYSISDSSVAYIIPNTNTLVALKEGSAIVYAKTQNNKTAQLTVTVLASKQQLSTPSNLKVNKNENKLTWISVPGAYQYEVEINLNNEKIIEKTVNNYLDLSLIENLTLEPGNVIEFKVRAIASKLSTAYENSNWTETLIYDELEAVQNLSYNLTTGNISFEYQEKQKEDQNLYFYINVSGASTQTFRILKNDEGKYIQSFVPTTAGEYVISVSALMSGKISSTPEIIKIVKLDTVTFEQNGQTIISKWHENESDYKINLTIKNESEILGKYSSENNKLVLENHLNSGEQATVTSFVEKNIKEQIVDDIKVYYINSQINKITIEQIETPTNLNVQKINDNSIKLIWENKNFEYKIYQNGELLNTMPTSFEQDSINYLEILIENLVSAGDYQFAIVATKANSNNNFYLDSNIAQFKKVVKFEQIQAEYDSDTSQIKYETLQKHINANLNLIVKTNITTSITQKIENLSGNIDITLSGTGEHFVEIYISKNEDENLYLSSDVQKIKVIKLESVIYTKQANNDNEIIIVFEKQLNASSYIVTINDETLSDIVSESIYRTKFEEVFANNKEYIRFTIKNINVAGKYTLNIEAEGVDSVAENLYIVKSDASEYEFHKLANPTLQISKIDSKTVTVSWNVISGENVSYQIIATNISSGVAVYNSSTFSTSCNITFNEAGEYNIIVKAKSSKENYLTSDSIIGNNNVNIQKLENASNILHEVLEDSFTLNKKSVLTFDAIANADSYKIVLENVETSLEIATFVNFELKNNKVVFNLGNVADIFTTAGQYRFKIFALTNNLNILDSEIQEYYVKKLGKPENISISYNDNSTDIVFTTTDINNNFKISIDGGDYVAFNEYKYDISSLNAGSHLFKIYSVGNNQNILDSDVSEITEKILVRLNAPTNVKISVDSSDDNNIIISFDKVQNASYYQIMLQQDKLLTFTFMPAEVKDAYTFIINRSQFVTGLQYLYVVAQPAENSEEFETSFNSNSIYIEKSSAVQNVSLSEDEKLILYSKQALINGKLFDNTILNIPELSGGQTITFKVRNISTFIDGYDTQNKFYLASEWENVSLTKLSAPSISISDENVNINYSNESTEYNLILKLDYFGLNNLPGEVLNSFVFNLTNLLGNDVSSFNIKQFIINNVELNNFVGDYKITIYAKPINAKDFKLYVTSPNSATLDYKFIENIENNNANYQLNNLGDISFELNNDYISKLNYIYIEIAQNSNYCKFKIDLKNNSINVISNDLNNYNLNLELINAGNITTFKVNLQKIINSGVATLSWKLLGDDDYYISASGMESETLNKLTTPEVNYSSDELGNKLILSETLASAMPSATFVARFNGEEIEFSKSGIYVYLYLPYEWTNISNITIIAIASEETFINSDEQHISFERAPIISDLHLTEDEINNKTYLEWTAPLENMEFIIYISQDNFTTQKIYTTTEAKLQITDEMIDAGDVKFRVVVKGYQEGDDVYLNSEFVELTCQKLANNASFANTNGILNWSAYNNESLLKQYRFIVNNTIYNFNSSVHTFDLQNLSGYLTLNFKLIGEPSLNIISSDAVEVLVYKFNAPNSFNIKNGKFYINESFSDINVNVNNIDFLININDSSFLYSDYLNYKDEVLEQFYSKLLSSNGMANANYVVKSNTVVVKDGKNYLVVNSDVTSNINFSIYQIDITRDEFYLTQLKLSTGDIETYFNWEWIDESYSNESSVRILIIPNNFNTSKNIENSTGWKTLVDNSGNVSAYYIDYSFNNVLSNGVYASSSVCVKLPKELDTGAFTIQVQKTSINSTTNLSSQNIKVLNFTKLLTPTAKVQNGQLNWNADGMANFYQMLYTNNDISTWSEQLIGNNFEPNSLFEDLSANKSFTFKLIAFGNVTELKPSDNLSALSKNYIIASNVATGSFTKLRQTGDLILQDGVLYWNENNEYNYYQYSTIESKIEIKFLSLALTPITSIVVPATIFNNSTNLIFLDDYLNEAQKNMLNMSKQMIIVYRQLGSTFANYINSEYRDLKIDGAPTITIDGVERNYFEFLAKTSDINISENGGLNFAAISYNNSLLSDMLYDVYFKINKEIILATTLTNKNTITFSEMKDLLRQKDPKAKISQIFVVGRGNNTYYLSSLKSAILNVFTINGEVTMTVDNGMLKWNNIEGAGSYAIKTVIDDEELTYIIKYENSEFKVNGVKTNTIYISDGFWYFNIAAYGEMADNVEHNLKIRYLPTNQGSNVFAFPGEWTENALRVYKIAKPEVSMEDGTFIWNAIDNALQYKISIVDRTDNSVILETNLTSTTFVLDLTAIAEKLSVKVSTVISNISNYQIKFQSIGSNASINGVYFISSIETIKEGLTLQENTITNLKIDKDTLSWDDENINSYIIYISGIVNGVEVLKTIKTKDKYYDLSKAELNGDSNTLYSVVIKVAGDNEKLASTETNAIEFKVLPSITSLSLKDGYITFPIQAGANSYTLTFAISSRTFKYVITQNGSNYIVSSVSNQTNKFDETLETEIFVKDGMIYIWPVNIQMNSSALISIKANGYEKDGVTYISSLAKTSGSPIYKPDISKIAKSKVVINKDQQQTNFVWVMQTYNFDYNLDIKLLKINSDGSIEEIDLSQALLSANKNKLTLNEVLEAGTYQLQIRVLPINSNYFMKSEWKTLTYNIN